MTDNELIAKIKNVLNYKTVYMWGVFGSPVTEKTIAEKSAQYPDWYTPTRINNFRSLIEKGYFAFDCVNLIKGILWGWNADKTKSYGGAKYNSNGVPDVSANGLIAKCTNVSTNFGDIVPCEVVWMDGHVGLYIGEGKVIECTPTWNNCVQMTACGNIGTITGLNKRTWTKHGKLPYITYTNELKEDDEVKSEMKFMVNGGTVQKVESILNADSNYPKLRPLMEALGIKVDYDSSSGVVKLTK